MKKHYATHVEDTNSFQKPWHLQPYSFQRRLYQGL